MNQRLLIAILTALGFAAGFAARSMTSSGPAVPPPPAAGTEFVRATGTAAPADNASERRAPTYTNAERDRLLGEIEKMRPKVDAYRQRIEQLATEFDRDLLPIFTPEQAEKFEHNRKKRASRDQQDAEVPVLSDEQIFQLQQRPLWHALWNVAINWRLDHLTKEYKLTEEQRCQIRPLLERRREQFLTLVDNTPPPSITLSQLATQADKLRAK